MNQKKLERLIKKKLGIIVTTSGEWIWKRIHCPEEIKDLAKFLADNGVVVAKVINLTGCRIPKDVNYAILEFKNKNGDEEQFKIARGIKIAIIEEEERCR